MLEQNLQKKYGLLTAICLVVGAVIGSGIFFVNETIFARVGGHLTEAIIAWLIGGAIMFVMMWVWGQLASGKAGMGGLLEYTDDLLGKTYSYFLGWFLGTILYPAFVAVLAWVTARFTATLFGWDMVFTSGPVWMLAGVYLVGIYVMNVISPKLAGFFQVSTTFIKVIPLILMGIVGLIVGIVNGTTAENLTFVVAAENAVSNPLFYAILSTVFAYAGSEEVLMMSSEIKNREKNLPRAIVVGSMVIIAIYVLYTIGVFGAIDVETLATGGGVTAAFQRVFGDAFGSVLMVFVIISCLGAMNSAMMAGSRAFYALAIRGKGPSPDYVKQVDAKTDMPPTSAAISLLFCGIIFFIVFANAQDMSGYPYLYHRRWFGDVNFAVSSLAPVTLMGLYIPVFVAVMVKQKEWHVFNRFIMPLLSIIGALALIYMVFYTNALGAWWYLAFFSVIMGIAAIFLVVNKKET
ncbi:MAG: amino acid permease [Defluviitaleaceae bacterium]|nr:amino acid permease [Defluviitaleaceae bacterium]